jgi:hypothetical protein
MAVPRPELLVASVEPPPAGRATPDPESLPEAVPPRRTASPLLAASGGAVLEGGAIRTGGAGVALLDEPVELGVAELELDDPELEEPELDDPELDDPELDGSEAGELVVPRGTA